MRAVLTYDSIHPAYASGAALEMLEKPMRFVEPSSIVIWADLREH